MAAPAGPAPFWWCCIVAGAALGARAGVGSGTGLGEAWARDREVGVGSAGGKLHREHTMWTLAVVDQ